MKSLKIALGTLSSILVMMVGGFAFMLSFIQPDRTAAAVTDPTEMLVISDVMYEEPKVEPPEQNITPELKEAIDEQTEKELHYDDYEATQVDYEYEEYSEPSYQSSYDGNFKSAGVVYGEDGTRYTWYSQNVLPGGGLTELNNNGRHVDENGYIRDGDGYIAVASNDYAQGTIIDTPFGEAKVYDSGCASGTVDIYTDF